MEHLIRAVVRYDGTYFSGWQIQPNARTVQGEIERVLAQVASQPIRIQGAARTDAGVHALGQVFSCYWPKKPNCWRICRSLSQILSPEVRVESVEEAPFNFNARYSAVSKRYAYTLYWAKEPDPFVARYAWRVPWQVDPPRMAALAQCLVGSHDFAGFECSGAARQVSTVRTLYSLEALQGGIVTPRGAHDLWRIEFHGGGFLYKMVRNIIGTLVEIDRGFLPETHLAERLAAPAPFRGYTAPPHGLTLIEVNY